MKASTLPKLPTANGSSKAHESHKINGDYESRKMNFCLFCGDKYNVGERIPRILVHCGHTFCTECLSQLHHNFRVRCPVCRKLIKNLESVERLPLNINVLYEVVERDPVLNNIDFDEEDPECMEGKLCEKHQQRVMHFYCSSHLTVFCRECIKEEHYEEDCFVVDLYEIEKMRKLQIQNMTYNKNQLKKRKDGANQSCVLNEFVIKEPKRRERKPITKIEPL
jgi:RING-type zinc-finger